MAQMRLDRFFSSQQILSRREIRPLLRAGLIRVNGVEAHSPDEKVDPLRDVISLRGERVIYKPYLYLMLNKPRGVVSATEDRTHTTVLDLVPPALWRDGLFPAGRLDRDTTGFVLLTDDGDFAHAMLSPRQHVPKTYEVRLDGALLPEARRRLEAGIALADGELCRPAELTLLEDGPEPLWQIVLHEGKYHQIKRMFGVVGLGVNALRRIGIGGLSLDPDLKEGEVRELATEEVEKILVK